MPELPEVETIVRGLRPVLLGRRIVACELRFPSIVRHPEPERFAERVKGCVIESVERRGKYILLQLNRADAAQGTLLVCHLGMTGQLTHSAREAALESHTHAVFRLDNRREVRYRDIRRFGRLLLGTEDELRRLRRLPNLGPEPLEHDFTASDLYSRLHRRRAPLKALLLDQSVIAGIGNIYADEALFRARIRPDRPGSSLSRASAARLHSALRTSLQMGIDNRGSSLSDYVDSNGERGSQQLKLQVYGHSGEPCTNCGRPLRSLRLAGRTTVYCPRCQH